MQKIQIDGEYLELRSGSSIQLNNKLLDLSDITKRGVTFSNVLTAPPTAKNERLLGYPSRLASNNKAFETSKKYILIDTSLGIISRGDVVIKEYDRLDGIKIQLVEGYSFWAEAGRRLLIDLDLHNDDFVFTTANMNALKSKGSSPFVTALHSATGDELNSALSTYNYTRPCYYFRVLLDRIITGAGYSADFGDALDFTELDFIGCLSNADAFFVSDYKRRFINYEATGVVSISDASNVFAKAGNVVLSGTELTNQLYKTSYVLKGTVNATQAAEIVFTFGSKTERLSVPQGISFINMRTDEVDINSVLEISTSETITFDDVYIYSAIAEKDVFSVTGLIDIEDYLVLADYNLPDQTQKGFIKNLLALNFLSVDVDEAKKIVSFSYLPNKISSNNSVDLSRWVDRYISIKGGETYGQLNVMKYKNDDDISESLGASLFNNENVSAKPTKSFLEIEDYSASEEIQISNETVLVADIYNVAENKRKSVSNRILYLQATGAFGINAVFTPVSMQSVNSNHYFDFIVKTKRERITNLTVNLTKLQFNELKRSPVVYVDFLDSHFLTTEITGFERSKPTVLKVIKYN